MGLGKPLHLRLFLEGQEVPVISAQVDINLNAPAAASIQVVPLDEVMSLKPRTMVHLFFLEPPRIADQKGGTTNSLALDPAKADDYYKLLFVGEIVGFSFVKQPISRAVVLQCLDFSSYWDFAQATALEYDKTGNAFTSNAHYFGSDSSLFDDIVNHQPERLTRWLRQTPETDGLKGVNGLAGGIIRLMEVMGGVSEKHRKGVNDFFTIAELRCRLLAQIAAEEGDDTASRLLNTQVFHEWLLGGLQNIGQQISLRDMVKLFCQYVYYDVAPNPAPKFDHAGTVTEETHQVTKKVNVSQLADASAARGLLDEVYREMRAIRTQWSETDLDNPDIPVEEIEKKSRSLVDDIEKKITPRFLKVGASGRKVVDAYDPAVRDLQKLKALYAAKTPHTKIWDNIIQTVDSAFTVLDTEVVTTRTKVTNRHGAETARLKTQILRPDCFMVPPPRCNVVFPEQYTSVTYDRTFIQEVTRTLVIFYSLMTGKANDNNTELISHKVLAPVLTEEAKKLAEKVKVAGTRLLMPHELHTGIIHRTEWLPDIMAVDKKLHGTEAVKLQGARLKWGQQTAMHHFFKYRIGPRQMQVATRFNPYLVCGFPSLVVTRPFYLDKTGIYTSKQAVLEFINDSKKMALAGMPNQFMGMVVSLTHVINQDGGATQYVMTHCRSHLGVDDEFVGTVLDTVKMGKSKRKVKYVLDVDEIIHSDHVKKEELLNHLIALTPQDLVEPPESQLPTPYEAEFGTSDMETKEVTTTTRTVTEASYPKVTYKPGVGRTTETVGVPVYSTKTAEAKALEDGKYVATGRIDGIEDSVKIPKGSAKKTTGSTGLFGKIAAIQVVEPYKPRQLEDRTETVYSRVIVWEEVEVSTTADIPVENVLRPSWMSTLYDNENVGPKIYQPFFGCDSVVDGLEVKGENGTVTTSTVQPRNPTACDDVSAMDSTEMLKKQLKEEAEARSLLSIERAVNTLSYMYGLVKSEKADVDEFISTYTWRPIASKAQVLGSEVQLRLDGKKVVVESGKVGFHTMSVHPVTAYASGLTGLTEDPDAHFERLDKAVDSGAIAAPYDVRREKLEKVMEYRRALEQGMRGFVG